MKSIEKRIENLEAAAGIGAEPTCRGRVIVDGETVEEVLARHGFTEDDNVIVRQIIAPKPRTTDERTTE